MMGEQIMLSRCAGELAPVTGVLLGLAPWSSWEHSGALQSTSEIQEHLEHLEEIIWDFADENNVLGWRWGRVTWGM
jgi:hypothetical protein